MLCILSSVCRWLCSSRHSLHMRCLAVTWCKYLESQQREQLPYWTTTLLSLRKDVLAYKSQCTVCVFCKSSRLRDAYKLCSSSSEREAVISKLNVGHNRCWLLPLIVMHCDMLSVWCRKLGKSIGKIMCDLYWRQWTISDLFLCCFWVFVSFQYVLHRPLRITLLRMRDIAKYAVVRQKKARNCLQK